MNALLNAHVQPTRDAIRAALDRAAASVDGDIETTPRTATASRIGQLRAFCEEFEP